MYKMLKISAETYAKNCVHSITDKAKKLQLRNKDTRERLGVQSIYDLIDKEIKGGFETKNPTNEQKSEYKKHGSELIKGEKFMYTYEDIITPIITYSKISTPEAIEFRSKLGFDQHDIPLSKEQPLVPKIMKLFTNEQILPQNSVFSYKIDLYFPEHKLAIEVHEKRHIDRAVHKEIQRQKAIEKELDYELKFIRINPDKKDSDFYVEIGNIYNHISESYKKLTKKSIKKIFNRQSFMKTIRIRV